MCRSVKERSESRSAWLNSSELSWVILFEQTNSTKLFYSSWTTSIESTSRIREPETRCAPCLTAHLNFQFHLFLDLGHLSSSQQKPRDSVLLVQILRTFCPQVPCEDGWPARRQIVFWQNFGKSNKNCCSKTGNARNSSTRPPKMVATANCFYENSNDNHHHLMKHIET